ncbi:MAG: hypothetical protein ACE5DK_06305 [Paracoccaceae bacterium]
MKTSHALTLLAAAVVLSACNNPDKSVDRTFELIDSHPVSQMKAGIWVDPHGCDHWIIDDGAEGYLSQRLDKYGKPVCSGIAPPNTTVGQFKNWVPDPI